MICGGEGELSWVENPPKGAGLVHWLNWPPQVWWGQDAAMTLPTTTTVTVPMIASTLNLRRCSSV